MNDDAIWAVRLPGPVLRYVCPNGGWSRDVRRALRVPREEALAEAARVRLRWPGATVMAPWVPGFGPIAEDGVEVLPTDEQPGTG